MVQSIVRNVADFVRVQVSKTIDRPSRLIAVPLYYLKRYSVPAIARFPRLVPIVLSILSNRWVANGAGKEFCDAMGYKLFQRGHPVQAWQCFDRSIRAGRATTDEYLMGTMCLYHGLGRFRDAMSLLARANELGMAEVEKRGLEKLSYRVLDNVWGRHIGHTATIDYVIKLGILEGRDRDDTIFYLPTGSKIANRFLLSQVAPHLRLIDNPADLPFDPSAVQALHFDYLGPRLPDGTTFYFSQLANKTYERWRAEGRGPIFKLPPEIAERGWAALRKAGVPQGAWFVALHVREGKWDGRDGGLHGILNADISTYLPAIAEITRRGGWVIRLGDPGMRPLPPLANVIDYCHSDFRSDWMDVFIAACCRFMVGTSSGPAFVPPMYGVPTVLTNWWPPAERAWHSSDIFIPKMPRRIADGEYLTLSETLSEPFSWCHSRGYLSDHEGVHVEDNDPEVIRAAVEEMAARFDGDTAVTEEVSPLQARAEQIYKVNGVFGSGHLAQGFLQRYSSSIK